MTERRLVLSNVTSFITIDEQAAIFPMQCMLPDGFLYPHIS